MRVSSNVLSLRRPTAQALVGDVAATPISKLLASGFGLAWTFHAVPFQCSIRVWTELIPVTGSGPLEEEPTAHALPRDSTVTPERSLSEAPGLGGCFGRQ